MKPKPIEGTLAPLLLKPKGRTFHTGFNIERVYLWCGKHQMAYNAHVFNDKRSEVDRGPYGRKNGECPWCWRERVAEQRKGRKQFRPWRSQANTQTHIVPFVRGEIVPA